MWMEAMEEAMGLDIGLEGTSSMREVRENVMTMDGGRGVFAAASACKGAAIGISKESLKESNEQAMGAAIPTAAGAETRMQSHQHFDHPLLPPDLPKPSTLYILQHRGASSRAVASDSCGRLGKRRVQ